MKVSPNPPCSNASWLHHRGTDGREQRRQHKPPEYGNSAHRGCKSITRGLLCYDASLRRVLV